MEGRGYIYRMLFSLHLAMSLAQENKTIPTDEVYTNPTTKGSYGPQNVILKYVGGPAPRTLPRKEGTSLGLVCEATCSPPCYITWYKDATIIPSYDGKTNLEITSIYRTQSGTYQCQARGVEGEKSSEKIAVTVQYGPQNVILKYGGVPAPLTLPLKEGTSLGLVCEAKCGPPCFITWYKDATIMSSYNGNTNLKITRIYRTQSGTYHCQARNVEGEKSSEKIAVTVQYGPQTVTLSHNGRVAPSALNLREGTDLNLKCDTECSPQCNIKWYKDGRELQSYRRNEYRNITSIYRTQSGRYYCQARNVEGEKSSEKIAVTVQYGPQTVTLSHNGRVAPSALNLREGTDLNLKCDTECSPQCNIKWYKDGRELQSYRRNEYRNITSIYRTQSGRYYCQARNVEGEKSSEKIAVTVQYGPQTVTLSHNGRVAPSALNLREGTDLNLKCDTECSPQCNIKWYKDGRELQSYRRNEYRNITSIYRTQSGRYYCQARGAEGELSSNEVAVTVQYGPSNVAIQYTSNPRELWEGSGTITITCNADCNPVCNYRLLHDRRQISTTKTKVFTMNRRISGQYSCAARNFVRRTYVISSNTVKIDIKYGPSNVNIQYTSNPRELREGNGKITITCNADCNPGCYWDLYHNGRWISFKKTNEFNMDRENSGQYRCAAKNSVRGTYVNSSNTVSLHIKYKTVTLSTIKKEMSLEVNRTLPSDVVCTVDCNYASCGTRTTITVLRDSDVYNTIHTNQSIFPRRPALVSDDGIYTCRLPDNTESTEDFRLRIKYGPRNVKITTSGSNAEDKIVLRDGYAGARLTCSSDCNPACSGIKWYKDGELLRNRRLKTIYIVSQRGISGNYKCETSGLEGTILSKQVKVTVHYSPTTVKVMPERSRFYSRKGGRPLENITCQADCLPKCSYTWKINIPYWRESNFNTGDTLFANKKFVYNNEKRFKCVAKNYVGQRESSWIRVGVMKGPGNVTITTKPSRGRQHEPFEMECSATCYYGCLSYSWFYKKKSIHNEELLRFNNLSRADTGKYTCAVKDKFGTTFKSYNLNVQYGPANVSIRYRIYWDNLIEGLGYVYLTCHADCNPRCFYTYYKNGQYTVKRNVNKERKNSGRYSCSAKNLVADTPRNSNNSVDIYIEYKPSVSVSPFPAQIAAPDSLSLNFSVDSFPPSNVTIFHEKEELDIFSNFTGDKTYEINIISCLDEGEYRIVAKNVHGLKSISKNLTFKCSPIILTSSNTTNKRFKIGDNLHLKVNFMANPDPNVSWTFVARKGDMPKNVPESLTKTWKGFTSIDIKRMNITDFGNYQLALTNKHGKEEKRFYIRGAPQPPTNLTVGCSTTALIKWTPGFDGGSEQSFVIEYTTNVSSSWDSYPHRVPSGNAGYLSTDINNLQSYVPYFFRVVAENPSGSRTSEDVVNCTLQEIEIQESVQGNEALAAGVGGAVFLLLVIAILVLVIIVKRKQRQSKRRDNSGENSGTQNEDATLGMVENVLYISAEDATNSIAPPANPSGSRDVLETGRGNDVYSVVMKTRKPESDTPVYAEVQKSQKADRESQKGKPPLKKKPTKSGKRSRKNVNQDGLVYVELDLKTAPCSSDGKNIIHGAEDKTQYVDVDFTKRADPVKE